eukprot:COSAG04_NODE_7287_length_1153_cov_21.212460_2_plen_110_part_00
MTNVLGAVPATPPPKVPWLSPGSGVDARHLPDRPAPVAAGRRDPPRLSLPRRRGGLADVVVHEELRNKACCCRRGKVLSSWQSRGTRAPRLLERTHAYKYYVHLVSLAG